MTETVWLQRPGVDVPWGFRLHGGRDYQTPLSVQKVTSGSIAATGLSQGDVILRIGEVVTSALTYSQAMEVIKNSGNLLQLSIYKPAAQGVSSPQPSTRLEQQLANMNVDAGYGRQSSYPYPPPPEPTSPAYQPTSPVAPPPPPAAPYYGGGAAKPHSPVAAPAPRQQHVIPDAVLNMAAKGGPDKKPFTYAPDADIIKEQRDKVRRSLKKDQGQDVTQSPVYRMIHGLDSDKPRRPVATQQSSEGQRGPRAPAQDDELCFSGVLDRSEIPSKSFHRLQNMTGGPDNSVDTSSIRHNVSGDGPSEEAIGDYDQASIRYTGKNIPSKSFRMLQSMTGEGTGSSSGSELTVPGQQRRIRRQRPAPEQQTPEQNPDDIVDISYVGGNIPSRSFKVLQHAMGTDSEPAAPQSTAPYGGSHSNGQSQGRTVKVIKLRQQQPTQQSEPSGVTDF